MIKFAFAGMALLLSVAGSAFAEAEQKPEKVAMEYMEAYSAFDLERMSSFWADDIQFRDLTAMGPDTGPDGHAMNGKEEAMAVLTEFAEENQPIELGFRWDTVFESNGRVVFMGEVNALYPTDNPDQVFRWRSPQVTVLTIKDGQITHQFDYADYDDADRSLVLQ